MASISDFYYVHKSVAWRTVDRASVERDCSSTTNKHRALAVSVALLSSSILSFLSEN